ncbi:MAG: hypothetical protein JSR66_03190 [Proteobacteria bacterium]|nr:hypothetical protein [Pseudomonadota bacterium]
MQRSIRRHQQRVAKLRRIRILRARGAFDGYCGLGYITPRWEGPDKPWAQMCRLVMNEPGWWRHLVAIVPARIDSHRLEHAIVRGRDADTVVWPDGRRPYPYYW